MQRFQDFLKYLNEEKFIKKSFQEDISATTN